MDVGVEVGVGVRVGVEVGNGVGVPVGLEVGLALYVGVNVGVKVGVNVGVGEHMVVTRTLPGHGAPAPVGGCIIFGGTMTVSPHAGSTTGY